MTESAPKDDNAVQESALPRPKPRRPWIQVSLLSIGIVIALAAAGGMLVVPRLMDKHYLDQIISSEGETPQAAVRWWAREVREDVDKRSRFVALWWSQRDNRDLFMRLGKVIVEADLLGEQSEQARLRYHRYARLDSPSAEERQSAVAALINFTGAASDELQAIIDQALADQSDAVAAEAAFVLPTWSDQGWAASKLATLLHSPRKEVLRRATLAAGLVARSLPDSPIPRAAWLAMRNRLVQIALDVQEDGQVRANAVWSLYRFRWMAQSARMMTDPRGPVELRRMIPPMLTNLPIEEDHSGPELGQALMAGMVLYEEDPLARTRAGLGLTMMASYGGLPQMLGEEVYTRLLRSRDWQAIAIACRLIGMTKRGDMLGDLESVVLLPERPDVVSEQAAYALGRLAEEPYQYQDSDDYRELRRRAKALLVVMDDPSRLQPATQPAATQPAPMPPTPRTLLAVATAWGRLGEVGPLAKLAGREMGLDAESGVSTQTMADMACLELTRLAQSDRDLRAKVLDAARTLAKSFSDRGQRSGALLIGLLGDADSKDWLIGRWRDELANRGQDNLTHIYMQVALNLLGETVAEDRVPVIEWLNDPQARTAGIYAGLLLTGQPTVLRDLLSQELSPSQQSAVDGLMDEWHLREFVDERIGGGIIRDIPAADEEMVRFVQSMVAWWYKIHRHRLTFDRETRRWEIRDAPREYY